jgi:hypothetical protein
MVKTTGIAVRKSTVRGTHARTHVDKFLKFPGLLDRDGHTLTRSAISGSAMGIHFSYVIFVGGEIFGTISSGKKLVRLLLVCRERDLNPQFTWVKRHLESAAGADLVLGPSTVR